MATREVIRDAPRAPLAPVDESVIVPEGVRRAAAAAEAIHAQAYPQVAPAVDPPAAVEPPVPPVVAASVQPVPPVPPAAPVDEGQWEHRYNSMKGRYDAAVRDKGVMQEQMSALADELQRTQQLLNDTGRSAPAATSAKLITAEETEHYSPELIDVMQRAAKEAIAPALQGLTNENNQLKKTLANTARGALMQTLDRDVPTWRVINDSAEFKTWVRLPDVYSGRVRYDMLIEAFRAGNAPRVTAFFNGYIRDTALVTGSDASPVPLTEAAPAAPSTVVPLVSLAAPGRAKPAGSGATVPAEKPILTRAQVAQFYRNVTNGVYNGREADKANDEGIISLAGREGRIR